MKNSNKKNFVDVEGTENKVLPNKNSKGLVLAVSFFFSFLFINSSPVYAYNKGWGIEQGYNNKRLPKPAPKKYLVICNKTTTFYDIQYTLDGSRYTVTQSNCNRHPASPGEVKISFNNPAQVKNYGLWYTSHQRYTFKEQQGGFFDLYH